jgi:molybdopterin/thiamine biosynthesis adenylyltransferase
MYVDIVKPRLKSFSRLVTNDEIVLIRDKGVELTLPDSEGQVLMLLNLLDGTRSVREAAEAMTLHWPSLTLEDVVEGIIALDEATLLEDAAAHPGLSHWQQERYFSNLAFLGTFASLEKSRYSFQHTLRRSHVVLLGVGGLGSTLLYNMAGLGVGHVTALDCDRVELKNLARQFLYSEAEVGLPKLDRAVERAHSFNSEMRITPVEKRVSGPGDIAPLLPGADLVLSAIDQPVEVQDWVNQACVEAGVPFITGGIQVARGLYYSVYPGQSGCLACWQTLDERKLGGAEQPISRDRINRGMGPVASLMGSLVALEAVRYLTGFAPPISTGKLWLTDFATGESGVAYEWEQLPDCPVCGREGLRPIERIDTLAVGVG